MVTVRCVFYGSRIEVSCVCIIFIVVNFYLVIGVASISLSDLLFL